MLRFTAWAVGLAALGVWSLGPSARPSGVQAQTGKPIASAGPAVADSDQPSGPALPRIRQVDAAESPVPRPAAPSVLPDMPKAMPTDLKPQAPARPVPGISVPDLPPGLSEALPETAKKDPLPDIQVIRPTLPGFPEAGKSEPKTAPVVVPPPVTDSLPAPPPIDALPAPKSPPAVIDLPPIPREPTPVPMAEKPPEPVKVVDPAPREMPRHEPKITAPPMVSSPPIEMEPKEQPKPAEVAKPDPVEDESPRGPTVISPKASDPPRESAKPSEDALGLPTVSVQARTPKVVEFGKPWPFELVVTNRGKSSAREVRIDDTLPTGAKLVSSEPQPEQSGQRLTWVLAKLAPGEERTIAVVIQPAGEGQLQLKPSVSIQTASEAFKVDVTRPKLQIALIAPEAAAMGEEVPFVIQVTNTGTGSARNVSVVSHLSAGLKHPRQTEPEMAIEAEIPEVKPGETRELRLRALAITKGDQSCRLAVKAEGAQPAATSALMVIHPPKVFLDMKGPAKAFVRGEAVYTVEVSNLSDKPSSPVQLAAAFPEGLELAGASDNGSQRPGERVVTWSLDPLPAGSLKQVSLKLRGLKPGRSAVRVVARHGGRSELKVEREISIEGIPAVGFEITPLDNPAEVGKETGYEIKVTNKGSVACTNVALTATLSEGLSMVGVSGPVKYRQEGRTVTFEPLERLGLKGEAVFRIRVRSATDGDQRCQARLACDQLRQPLSKDESIHFYRD